MTWSREAIVSLLLEAGEIASRAQEDMSFELKADRSIVTPADRSIERLFAGAFDRPAEGLRLIGEETVESRGEDYIRAAFEGEAFVVDPIDGTAPFAHLMPTWGISIGRMVRGRLIDGAVYLPDFGEILISEGDAVLEGRRRRGAWAWRELGAPADTWSPYGLLAVTQEIAKRGRVTLPNPVMVLGAAVVPLLGLIQGRFLAYIGSVKLWDIAGALPLLLRKGLSASVVHRGERREVTEAVDERTYDLDPGSLKRWALRSDLVVCRRGDEARFRAGFTSGEAPDASAGREES